VYAVFFLAGPEVAIRVTSSDDPDVDVAAELALGGPTPLVGLGEILGAAGRVGPLRDATCRSFPVWDLGSEITRCVALRGDDELDALAERWHARHPKHFDAAPYELASCLGELRDAIRAAEPGHRVFALLEERAM